MGFENILIGTGILWLLTGLIVIPIAQRWTEQSLGIIKLDDENLSTDEKAKINSIFTEKYILVHIFILGIAGLIGGLLGYYFIAVSLEAKSWPGIIAFIVCSFIGLSLRGGQIGI